MVYTFIAQLGFTFISNGYILLAPTRVSILRSNRQDGKETNGELALNNRKQFDVGSLTAI